MQRQQVRNEDISTPRRYHVSVEQGGQRAPEHGTFFDGLDPEEKGEDKQEDGDCLVIVASGNRTRNIAGCNTHKSSSKQASGGRSDHFRGQEVGSKRGEA